MSRGRVRQSLRLLPQPRDVGPALLLLLVLLLSPALGGELSQENLTVVHAVNLLPTGDGLWTFERRYRLDTGLDERAWNAMNLTSDSPEFRVLVEGLRRSVEEGARAAGRPMEARNFALQVRREQGPGASTGVVAVRFEWRGLVGPQGRFGDAFPDGIPLGTGDAFVLRYPQGLSPTYTYPPADLAREGELVWLGPRNLGAGEPFVRLQPASSGSGPLLASLLGAAGAAAALFAMVWRRKSRPPTFEVDEGVVLKLVEEAGELLQGAVIEKTGWSKARVSKILTSLERRGLVEKVRKGRENLVRFRGERP